MIQLGSVASICESSLGADAQLDLCKEEATRDGKTLVCSQAISASFLDYIQFDEGTIRKLPEITRWDWPVKKINKNLGRHL